MNIDQELRPVFAAQLLPRVDGLLVELLRSLDAGDWEAQTVAPRWKVKDVAAHLLDTQLRKLSVVRDGYAPEAPGFATGDEFVAFINRLNHEGVSVYRRLSPDVLITLMEVSSRESAEYHLSLDPFAPARFPVSWAGEERSQNWFDTAREYTERWHHQQQIRLATGRPGLMTRELYYPVLDTFMRALPFHYRSVEAAPGGLAQFNVSGECGGAWYLYRSDAGWRLVTRPVGEKVAEVTIPQEIAWRVFTKGIDRQSASARTSVLGDSRVGLHVLNMLSVVG
jgi:uncharacterized protein (TIGR03083 family)